MAKAALVYRILNVIFLFILALCVSAPFDTLTHVGQDLQSFDYSLFYSTTPHM